MCGCHLSSTCPVSRPIIVPIDCPALRHLRANNPVIEVSFIPKKHVSLNSATESDQLKTPAVQCKKKHRFSACL